MSFIPQSFLLGAMAAGLILAANPEARASENQRFQCGGNGISISIELEPETGSATIASPRGAEQLSPDSDGVWRDATEELQFFADDEQPKLWMGSEQFDCRPAQAAGGQDHASGAVGGNETMVNLAGRSLGGRLRNGPGTNFSAAGSLAEGTPLTIIANTGVRFDGYDWFEIRVDGGKTAYQWGGIMCSEGQLTSGVYEQCRGSGQSIGAGTGQSGYMAFAVGPDGRFGHGKAQTQREAETYAMGFCGADCRIDDVTTARCHALATVPGGMWFGAAPSPEQAQTYAMNFCEASGASGCRIDYSICQ